MKETQSYNINRSNMKTIIYFEHARGSLSQNTSAPLRPQNVNKKPSHFVFLTLQYVCQFSQFFNFSKNSIESIVFRANFDEI